ncbi:MAG: PulJ/GspJ family protein [Opitutales bacterium]
MSRPVPSARSGFTLVELLVASAIMVTIVLIVAKIAVDTLSAYDRVVADLSTQAEARAVLDNMERDFNSAVIRPDGRCWMEIIAPEATGDTSGLKKLANIPSDLQPVVMFFSAPTDRPRWTTSGTTRTTVSGETCAVAYRLGRRSPFDLPGSTLQQVYCFQRTIIDAQNTFNEAIPLLTVPTTSLSTVTSGTPFTYWYATRTYINPYGGNVTGALISSSTVALAPVHAAGGSDAANTNGGWTMDEQNFCAQNTVGLSITLWCASSESAAADLTRVLTRNGGSTGLPPSALRPVTCYPAALGDLTYRGALHSAGYGVRSSYGGLMARQNVTTDGKSDFFGYRARVYSDRIQTDTASAPLPYALRQVEASVIVLSPAGARELRGIQAARGVAVNEGTDTSEFRRIVATHGRPYSRRMIVLGNGN